MRIRDWSSHVCSSDLLYYLVQCARRLKQEDAMLRHARAARDPYPESEWTMQAHRWAGNYSLLENNSKLFQLGRASCRERECQYVYISVVAGSLKKNHINSTSHWKQNRHNSTII